MNSFRRLSRRLFKFSLKKIMIAETIWHFLHFTISKNNSFRGKGSRKHGSLNNCSIYFYFFIYSWHVHWCRQIFRTFFLLTWKNQKRNLWIEPYNTKSKWINCFSLQRSEGTSRQVIGEIRRRHKFNFQFNLVKCVNNLGYCVSKLVLKVTMRKEKPTSWEPNLKNTNQINEVS